MKRKIIVIVLSFFVMSINTGWARHRHTNLIPVNVSSKNLPSISVAKVNSEIAGAVTIGVMRHNEQTYSYNRKLKSTSSFHQDTHNITAGDIFNVNAVKDYERIVASELKQAGYKVLGSSSSDDLFGNSSAPVSTRYKIGAIIKQCNVRVIDDLFSQSQTEFNMEDIQWEIYDTKIKKVIHIAHSTGWGRHKGIAVTNAAEEAFRRACRNFLADQNLVLMFEHNR